ncbi:hypothetical protein GQ42DRAFT_155697 [Ramicandelaber brevisporus]|nr:hypothetical protein GQ42DRAFT_155697 [Ramicandelaber brevisporus]
MRFNTVLVAVALFAGFAATGVSASNTFTSCAGSNANTYGATLHVSNQKPKAGKDVKFIVKFTPETELNTGTVILSYYVGPTDIPKVSTICEAAKLAGGDCPLKAGELAKLRVDYTIPADAKADEKLRINIEGAIDNKPSFCFTGNLTVK